MSEKKEKAVSVMIDGELVVALKRIQKGIKTTVDADEDLGLTVEPSLGFIVRAMLRQSLGMKKSLVANQEGSNVNDRA